MNKFYQVYHLRMEICLLCVAVILVALAGLNCEESALQTKSLALAGPPAPTTKTLYGSGGFVLAENFPARVITYYHKNGDLIFENKNNDSMVHLDEFMKINGDQLKKQNLSFAVVSFAYKPTDKREQEFCRRQSNAALRHLIVACRNKIILRPLTGEETRRIEQYKEEKNGKPSPPSLNLFLNKYSCFFKRIQNAVQGGL